jgi:hypothetical protein
MKPCVEDDTSHAYYRVWVETDTVLASIVHEHRYFTMDGRGCFLL